MYTYDVAIRTLGTGGEKYQKLLNSIDSLVPKPEKVIVVLPDGYELPKQRLGYETFVFCPKSMILQRLTALKYSKADFILFSDDDIEFDSDFVSKLAEPLLGGKYACSAGPLLSFFPPSGFKYFLASLLGGACVMLHGRDKYYVRILCDGGWSYNRSVKTSEHKIYETESLAWTCFLANRKAVKKIHFETEMWLERVGYSAFEDRVWFYKLMINGFKSCVVSDALYIHNDGKTSTRSLKLEPIYAGAFNHYVFWHRYIYSLRKGLPKALSKLAVEYHVFISKIYCLPNKQIRKTASKGFKDAKAFVKSSEYASLPPVEVFKE